MFLEDVPYGLLSQSYVLSHARKGALEAFLLDVVEQSLGDGSFLIQIRKALHEGLAAVLAAVTLALDVQANPLGMYRQIHIQLCQFAESGYSH